MTLDTLFELLIAVLGLVLVVFTIKDSRSLIGSFFKAYYRYMIGAVIALTIGFVLEPAGELLGLEEGMLDMISHIHHAALAIASILFIYASRILPKDAASYIEANQK